MPKNIAIFSDGTAMVGGRRPDELKSNVYKLYHAARIGSESGIDPAQQICFYEAGLGTTEIAGAPWLRPIGYTRKVLSLGLGTGFMSNVVDCYETILKYYEPGDRVFLVGFSRGAYTVRTVCSVMNLCGVPTKGKNGDDLPRAGRALRYIANEAVFSVYGHGLGKERRRYEAEREELARRFREKYHAQDDRVENARGNVAPYFVGVFDTVASLGASGLKRAAILALAIALLSLVSIVLTQVLDWLLPASFGGSFLIVLAILGALFTGYNFKAQYRSIRNFPNPGDHKWHLAAWRFHNYDMYLDPRIGYARHAIAIDEDRADFPRVGWAKAADVRAAAEGWIIQRWFAGSHSDIGGGTYPEAESRLSDIPLQWMIREVTSIPNGMKLDLSKLNVFPDPNGFQHCEVRAMQDMYPDWVPGPLRVSWKRQPRSGVMLENCDDSVLERIKADHVYLNGKRIKYRPEQLSEDPNLATYYTNGLRD